MGQLTTKLQARYLIAFGWLALAIAMFYSTKRIDLQISFSAATWLRIAQVIGLGFLVRADHAGGLHRNCAGEEQRRRRNHQFHAQYRKQRRNVAGHHVDCAALAVPSGEIGRKTSDPTIPTFQNSANGLAQRLAALGIEHARRAAGGLMPEFIKPCRRRRRAWPTSILLWCLPWERRSCSA